MSKLSIAVAIVVVVLGRPAAADEQTDVMVPVRQFIEGFNKSDLKMAESACAEDASIIDDFPPHAWRGSGAVAKWFNAFQSYATTNSIHEAAVTLDKPKHVDVTGPDAYVVVPAGLRMKKKEETVNETAVMTLVLHKSANNWRITAWSWADN